MQIPPHVPVIIVVAAMGSCARPAPVPTELLPPSEAAQDAPAPADALPMTVTSTPAPPPPQELSPSTQVPAQPPASASLGDTWTRPADEMVMVYVRAGEFPMGSTHAQLDEAFALCSQFQTCLREAFESEQPAHTVAVDGFWIDRTEVTNAQYRRCVEAGACEAPEF